MLPTFKKLEGISVSASVRSDEKLERILVSACPSTRLFFRPFFQDMVLKFHVWIPHGKIVDIYFPIFPLAKLLSF